MAMRIATARADHTLCWKYAVPAIERTRKISIGAYATEDSGSDAKIGSAIRFGSSVSASRSLRIGAPTKRRFGTFRSFTSPGNVRPAAANAILMRL